MILAPQWRTLHSTESCVLFARYYAAGITGLAHSAQSPGIADSEVFQTVLYSRLAVLEAGALAAIPHTAFLPVGVDVSRDLVRGTPSQMGFPRVCVGRARRIAWGYFQSGACVGFSRAGSRRRNFAGGKPELSIIFRD